MDPSGQFLHFSTYWGGDRYDAATGIAADDQGNVFVVGTTRSPDMPVTSTALDRRCGSDGACNGIAGDAFLLKIGPTGQLQASSFYGGGGLEAGRQIAIRPEGGVQVLGTTQSPDFPLIGSTMPERWRSFVIADHTFLSSIDDRLERVTRAEIVADEEYLPNVAVMARVPGPTYVAGQVSATSGMTTGCGTFIRSLRQP